MERTQKNIRNDDAEASGWDNTEKERLSVRKRKKKAKFSLKHNYWIYTRKAE
jgi:hypothetical protein